MHMLDYHTQTRLLSCSSVNRVIRLVILKIKTYEEKKYVFSFHFSLDFNYDQYKEFEREGHLKKHQSSKSCLKNCNVFCNNCNMGFAKPENLNFHIKKFNCKKRYKCANCDEYFRIEKDLLSHFESMHS